VRALGRFTAFVGVIAGIAALVVGVQSIPDIKRYLKIRAM
jgi:hypothetical protein